MTEFSINHLSYQYVVRILSYLTKRTLQHVAAVESKKVHRTFSLIFFVFEIAMGDSNGGITTYGSIFWISIVAIGTIIIRTLIENINLPHQKYELLHIQDVFFNQNQ